MDEQHRAESMHQQQQLQAPPPQAEPVHVAAPVQQYLALAMPGTEHWTDRHDEWLWESREIIGARMRDLAALRGQPCMTEFTEHGLQLVHQVPKPVRKPRGDGDKPHKRKKTGDIKKPDGSTEKVQKFEWRQALKMPLGWMQKVYECASQPSGIRTACYMAPDGTRYNNKVAAIAAMAIEQNPANVPPHALPALEAPQAQQVQNVSAVQAVHDQALHDQQAHAQALHDQQVHAQAVQAVHDQAAHAQAMHEQAVQAQAAHEQALHAQAVQAAQAQAAHDQAVAAVQAQAMAAVNAAPVSVPVPAPTYDHEEAHVPVPASVPAMVD